MKTTAQQVRTIDLARDQVLVLDGPRTLRVLCGQAWMTDEGPHEDRWLHAGAELVLGRGRTLIQALGPARVQVVERAARGSVVWERLRRGWQQLAVRGQLGPAVPESCF